MPNDFLSGPVTGDIHFHLGNLSYYTKLSEDGKKSFVKRVRDFMNDKRFQPAGGLEEVAERMKVLISASAVQLTFGLKNFDLSHFHTIRVYPRIFYSRFRDAHMKGGTSMGGVIMFSWEDFVEGYRADDRYNLGLHEMAHALKITVFKGSDFDLRFASYIDTWETIGVGEFEKIRQGNSSFLRSYAGTNMHEFFSVCVEHFFELPREFRQQLPDIYNHLCILLNQDPLNHEEDYRLRNSFIEEVNRDSSLIPVPKKIKQHFKYHTWHWSLSVLLLGISGGLIVIAVLYRLTVIEPFTLLGVLLVSSTLGSLQWTYFKSRSALRKQTFILYSIFGFGFCVTALVLLLNYCLPVFPETTEVHRIRNYHLTHSGSSRPTEIILNLENDAYIEYPGIRTFDPTIYKGLKWAKTIRLKFRRGIFGFKVLTGCEYQ